MSAPIRFTSTHPILRIFDEAKAREFYLGFLGFTLDWEHRFEPGFPLYAQVSRNGLALHLSGHHGDGTPGSCVFVRMTGIAGFHREISARNYPHMRPGLDDTPLGREMIVIDPFGNTLRFCETPEKTEA
jgi:catechol 2,3-dioxygenase-like lactoylglutathione lyase family enzyme